MITKLSEKNLVILWGWGRNDRSFQGLINTAPSDWKIYPIQLTDLLPKGKIEERMAAVSRFLTKHNLAKASFLGHSVGGALALEFAYHYPERVTKLYLADSEGVHSKEPTITAAMTVFRDTYNREEGPVAFLRYISRLAQKPILHIKLGRFAHHVDLQKEAKRVKVPTVILWGEKDGITPLWQGKILHKLIPKSKTVIFKDQGHDWIIYNPELFWKNI